MKKQITIYLLQFLFFVLFFCSGCIGIYSSYQPTLEYDITVKPIESTPSIFIYQFRNDSSSSARFQFREKSGLIVTDPYKKFVSEPGRLVSRALNQALNKDNSSPKYKVTGSIDLFEIDKENKIFNFSGFYSIIGIKSTNEFRFSIKASLKDLSAQEITCAVSKAVNTLAGRIVSTVHDKK